MHVPENHGITTVRMTPLYGTDKRIDRDDDPDEPFEAGEEWWDDVLRILPTQRERQIVRGWSHGRKLREMSAEHGVSVELIRQLKERSLKRIRTLRPDLEEQIR
jgi:hypothetical protein